MQIKRHQLRELQYLQEDIAEYFTEENMVSGETYGHRALEAPNL